MDTRKLLTCLITSGLLLSAGSGIAHASDQGTFGDVPTTHHQHKYITYSARQGWLVGYTDGTFRPGRAISTHRIDTVIRRAFPDGATRADVASFLRAGELFLGWNAWKETVANDPPGAWRQPSLQRSAFRHPDRYTVLVYLPSETGAVGLSCRGPSDFSVVWWYYSDWGGPRGSPDEPTVTVSAEIRGGPAPTAVFPSGVWDQIRGKQIRHTDGAGLAEWFAANPYTLHLEAIDGNGRTAAAVFDLEGADTVLPAMIDQCSPAALPFADVAESHPQAADIAYAADKGWFRGYSDGTFRSG